MHTGKGPKSAMPIYYKLKEYACQGALFGRFTIPQFGHHYIFSATVTPPRVPGVSKNAPASTKLEFGSLVR